MVCDRSAAGSPSFGTGPSPIPVRTKSPRRAETARRYSGSDSRFVCESRYVTNINRKEKRKGGRGEAYRLSRVVGGLWDGQKTGELSAAGSGR